MLACSCGINLIQDVFLLKFVSLSELQRDCCVTVQGDSAELFSVLIGGSLSKLFVYITESWGQRMCCDVLHECYQSMLALLYGCVSPMRFVLRMPNQIQQESLNIVQGIN